MAVAISREPAARDSRLHGIQRTQAGSHKRLANPIPMNTARHPNRAMSKPAPKVPTAGPHRMAEMITPFANPREVSGRCSAKSFEQQGNATDSPNPNNKRITANMAKPWTMPVADVASDHTKYPAAITTLASNRSTSHPLTNCIAVYDQKKAESRKPSWDAEIPNSSLSNGAAIDRFPRST